MMFQWSKARDVGNREAWNDPMARSFSGVVLWLSFVLQVLLESVQQGPSSCGCHSLLLQSAFTVVAGVVVVLLLLTAIVVFPRLC